MATPPRIPAAVGLATGPALLASTLWLSAWLRGVAAPDDLLEVLARAAPGAAPGPLLADVRATGADRVWLLLPRPGHTRGWPRTIADPPEPAALLTDRRGEGWLVRPGPGRWRLTPCPADLTALESAALTERQGRRAFEQSVTDAAQQLARMGLDRAPATGPRPAWSAALHPAPPAIDSGTLHVLDRCATVLDALDAALADDGAAVTSGEARARATGLRALRAELEQVMADVVGGLNPRRVA